jgi:hypothetical protein
MRVAAAALPTRNGARPPVDDIGTARINAPTTNPAGRIEAPRFVLQEQMRTYRLASGPGSLISCDLRLAHPTATNGAHALHRRRGHSAYVNTSTTNAPGGIGAPRFVLHEQNKTRCIRHQSSSRSRPQSSAPRRETPRTPHINHVDAARINAPTTNAIRRFGATRFVLREQNKSGTQLSS